MWGSMAPLAGYRLVHSLPLEIKPLLWKSLYHGQCQIKSAGKLLDLINLCTHQIR